MGGDAPLPAKAVGRAGFVAGGAGQGEHGEVLRPALLAAALVVAATFVAGARPRTARKGSGLELLWPTRLPRPTASQWAPPSASTHRYMCGAGGYHDAAGRRVRLLAVNWYGAESPEYVVGGLDRRSLSWIAAWIKANGFNAVRVPFSNQLWETNPPVEAKYLSANKSLIGMHAREILDRVVQTLGAEGLMVVLDDHTTNAAWCCKVDDGNGLWYGKRWDGGEFTEGESIRDWAQVAKHYASDPWVVGVELRNEPRTGSGGAPYWGDPAPVDCGGTSVGDRNDWPEAATCAANAVLGVDKRLVIVVDGVNFSTDLSGVREYPIRLDVSGRLIYAAHSYSWEDAGLAASGPGSYRGFERRLESEWGYISGENLGPVWVSEFGTCLQGSGCTYKDHMYFAYMRRYLGDGGFSWAYWALNGTQSVGRDLSEVRTYQAPEAYGLLNPQWSGPSDSEALADLRRLQATRVITVSSS